MGQAITKQWKSISDDAAATMAAPAPTRHVRSRSSSLAVLRGVTQAKTRPKNGFATQRTSKSADTIRRTLSSGELATEWKDEEPETEFSLRIDANAVEPGRPPTQGSYKDVQSTYEDWAEHEKKRRQEELARQREEVERVLKRTSILSLSMAGQAVEYESAAEKKRREAREWAKREMEERLNRDKRTFGTEAAAQEVAASNLDPSWSTDFDFDDDELGDEDDETVIALHEEECVPGPSLEEIEPAELSRQRRAAAAAAAAAAEAAERLKGEEQDNWGGVELVMDMNEEEFTGDFGKDEILHTVMPQDTLQGLGLRYSVPIVEIERVNSIHSNEELHIRDYVIIPTSRELAETLGKPDERSEYEERCISIFKEEMQCTDDRLVERYLRRTGFSVQEAIAKFLFDQAKHRAFEHRKEKEKRETGEEPALSTGGMTFVVEEGGLHLDLPDHFISPHNDAVFYEPTPDEVPVAAVAPKRRMLSSSSNAGPPRRGKAKPSSKCD